MEGSGVELRRPIENSRHVLRVDVQEAQRTLDLPNALLAHVEIEGCGGEMAMAKEMLKNGDLGSGLD